MNKLIEREEKFEKIMMLAERIGDIDAVLETLADRIEDFEDYEDEITDLQYRMDDVETQYQNTVSIEDFDEYIDYNEICRGIGLKLCKTF